ncbi:MAG TPA: phosphoglycerate dehydrogenase [Cytophagales bacterium]|nr:phosphoglycerate dehydrogenase [Cytophagales bacterium]HAP59114.1 phosphoglycerate dehydrogenase [Cytophagales bacterium]
MAGPSIPSLPKVVIVNFMHESIITLLEEAGFEALYVPTISPREIPPLLETATGLIIRSKVFVDEQLLGNAKALRFVARAGAGVDNVDVDYLDSRGIPLLNAPEGNRDALAEHTMGMLLMLFNRLRWADQEVRDGIWERERNRGIELMGKTVGIFGYGYMGQAFAQRLSGFGCRVLAYDKYKSDFAESGVEEVDLDTLYAETDILSMHVPLTEETRFIANEEFFRPFAKPIYVVNTSRGEVLPLDNLVTLMKQGRVLGAVLDVLENEKLKTLTPKQAETLNYLQSSEKTVFSPHVAGWSVESYKKINEILVEKIKGLDQQV